MTRDLNGYATDIPYLRDFKPPLAPARLDHVALVAGVEPPARKAGFAWCDLGCGQGVTANILAATHPGGTFHAIDAMPVHIDHARRLAGEAGIPNVAFHRVDFAAAVDLDLPLFDYIVAHGVYSWVDIANQRALRRFFDRRLKPGGLVYVSYNAMPGWARDLPFQRLARELARASSGDSAARVDTALEIIRALVAAEVPALTPSFIVSEIEQRPEDYTRGKGRVENDRARAGRFCDIDRKSRFAGAERERPRDAECHFRSRCARTRPRLLPGSALPLRCLRA
jgi:SAM-dependent methyltransferase